MSDAESSEALPERVAALEATVAELREAVATATDRDIPLLTGTLRALMDADIETVEDLPEHGRGRNEQLTRFEERLGAVERRLDALGDVGTDASSKAEKFAAVLRYAENKTSADQSKVAISAREIKGSAGVSRRYAYELIERMADEVAGVRMRDAQQVTTGSGTTRKKKALLVDCEMVHDEAGGVNSFTTDSESSGSER